MLDSRSKPAAKRGRFASSSSPSKSWSIIWHLRRYRTLFLTLTTLSLLFYYVSHRRTPFFAPQHEPSLRYKSVDWRYYAYSQYATNSAYLCNSVMVFEALDRLGSKADRILLYPEEWDLDISSRSDRDSQLLVKAKEWYGVKLIPIQVQKFETKKDGQKTWDESVTKFLTFNQTQYLRILHFDSDVTVFKHMDELFLLPPATVAMARAYWSLPSIRSLTSLFILLEPSERETARLIDAARSKIRKENEYDMEILNNMYGDSAMVLSHKQFGLLSGEFRASDHTNFLGNDYEVWDPDRAMRQASLVHFSDWPLPKPWIMWPRNLLQEQLPKCDFNSGTDKEEGCRNREIWLELYNDFRRRRKDICGLLSVPAPEWPPRKKGNETKSENRKPV